MYSGKNGAKLITSSFGFIIAFNDDVSEAAAPTVKYTRSLVSLALYSLFKYSTISSLTFKSPDADVYPCNFVESLLLSKSINVSFTIDGDGTLGFP